jgi:hypothetical protein
LGERGGGEEKEGKEECEAFHWETFDSVGGLNKWDWSHPVSHLVFEARLRAFPRSGVGRSLGTG